MSLRRITGRATKCGPSALSAITGQPTHDCAATIRRVRRDGRPVRGVKEQHLVSAAWALGWNITPRRDIAPYPSDDPYYVHRDKRDLPTLAQWCREQEPGVYVVVTGMGRARHYVAVELGQTARGAQTITVADSCNRKPVPLADADTHRFGPRSRVSWAAWAYQDESHARAEAELQDAEREVKRARMVLRQAERKRDSLKARLNRSWV